MTRTGRICSARMGSACAVRALTQRCGAGCDLKSLDLLQIRARLLTSLRYAERVVVFGSYLRQTLIKNGFNPARISIVPPFSRYAVNGASSHYPQSTQQTRQILFASRLTTDKGVDDALWLAAILGRSGRNVRMLVAGDGPLAPLVVKAAREPGSRVEYRGKLGTTELSQALAESSFVVMPSLWPEPFGLIGLEALAHGRPVIAYRSGGIPDWLAHYKSGILVNVGDRAALLTAAYQLLDDPSLAESLGIEGARQVRHRFSLETSLDALENVLHDAIQQRSHEPGKSASNVAAMANAQ